MSAGRPLDVRATSAFTCGVLPTLVQETSGVQIPIVNLEMAGFAFNEAACPERLDERLRVFPPATRMSYLSVAKLV